MKPWSLSFPPQERSQKLASVERRPYLLSCICLEARVSLCVNILLNVCVQLCLPRQCATWDTMLLTKGSPLVDLENIHLRVCCVVQTWSVHSFSSFWALRVKVCGAVCKTSQLIAGCIALVSNEQIFSRFSPQWTWAQLGHQSVLLPS